MCTYATAGAWEGSPARCRAAAVRSGLGVSCAPPRPRGKERCAPPPSAQAPPRSRASSGSSVTPAKAAPLHRTQNNPTPWQIHLYQVPESRPFITQFVTHTTVSNCQYQLTRNLFYLRAFSPLTLPAHTEGELTWRLLSHSNPITFHLKVKW